MTPALSVLVPCYNYAHYLGECMESILCQTLKDFEVIAIDDASTDDTPSVLSRFTEDPRVRLISHSRNIGHLKTYAEGIAAARGRHIVIVSADDRCLVPNAFERQVQVLEEHPSVGFVHSAEATIDAEGNFLSIARLWERDFVRSGLEDFPLLLFANHVGHSGAMVRRRCHLEEGGYDEDLPHFADWEMWLRLSAHYDIGYIADPLYAYRQHGENMSIKTLSASQAIDESRAVINKAFRHLPSEAAERLQPLRRKALRLCLLHQAEVELWFDRKARAWRSLLAAVGRDPTVLVTSRFPLRLALRTILGERAFQRLRLIYRRMRPGQRQREMIARV